MYALVANDPGRLAAGVAVGAASAGLAGLVVAVLWRKVDPRELFKAGGSAAGE
jgi:hypothetical protein